MTNKYKVVVYITSMNEGKHLGSTFFETRFEAEELASNFEELRKDALAFVDVVEGE